ncbi:MAG TPA: NAD(P) transhydrogenase subunit alpha [Bacilli bacterium]|nr:NAD(P) transhydrogenase subunit alpha [Bacilli bacterium]
MHPLILVLIFIISTILGYFLIKNVPSLLHTPLMSGMNALSGLTIIGALVMTAILVNEKNTVIASIIGSLAIILSCINLVGGFVVTDRMLKMFKKKRNEE